ncbi:MAG: polyphosphate polymerase domain-containing protein [Methanospirillum sp.]|uniref:polyphosphate polymerase domain-containing protein n=1 Tax=Methanospirillum sp. TaxID=45200 RepID=UPI00236C3C49|nr:polyphosphate polymerase domain-containing protein [Methanospirillum sp.]MDD1730392.1 polyphosphate polymerase domain-containing protein [Methanospirillum sp.]
MEGIQQATGKDEPLDTVLDRFRSIGLTEMEHANLQDRKESKYLLTAEQAKDLIAHLPDTYRVFEANGQRVQTYSTTYYDSPRLSLYLTHHNGNKPRYKVRTRSYVGSDLNFLEVKEKKNTGRTIKHRLQTEGLITNLGADLCEFFSSCLPFDYSKLKPVLVNEYKRITMVSTTDPERITLDVDLTYHSDSADLAFPEIVIAELKRSSEHSDSPAFDYLTRMRVKPKGFSKYCIGISLLYGNLIKHNNFNMTLRLLQKLMHGGSIRC